MPRRLVFLASLAALVASLLVTGPAEGARKKKRPAKVAKRSTVRQPPVAPTPRELYGPPAPTPVPWLRAAGTCVGSEPGHYLILAEVGDTGRVFWVDVGTEVEAKRVGPGDRLRVLWMPGPDGPVARKVTTGPVASPPP